MIIWKVRNTFKCKIAQKYFRIQLQKSEGFIMNYGKGKMTNKNNR